MLCPYESTSVPQGGGSLIRRAVVKARPAGPWSRQSSPDIGWVFDIRLYTREVMATRCTASGACTTSGPYIEGWAECATGWKEPLQLELEAVKEPLTAKLDPVVLKFRLTHAGLPVRMSIDLDERANRYGNHGQLQCAHADCRGRPWYQVQPDAEGRFELKFQPWSFKPARIPLAFTCATCGNQVEATLVMQPEIVVGFFNGVGNTRKAARSSMNRLEVEFGSQYKETPLKYAQFYNQTACGEGVTGKLSCLEDVAEVFEQRSEELGGVFSQRWETFWDLLAGRHRQAHSFTGRLVELLGDGGNALLQWLDASFNAVLNQLMRDTLKLLTLFKDSPTYENRANHMERLWRHADEGHGLLLVAHSQGNLFVNSAFDALKAFKPQARAQVVHVAPASPTLRGDHVLADIDLVINALRVSGINTVPDSNVALPMSKADPSGHGFEPTYLDKSRAAHARTRNLLVQSLDVLVN